MTLADRDRMKPELRYVLYKDVSAKNALINKYLKKIAEKAQITTKVSMHMSRHAFAHIALESGVESSAIKDILGHSNLATTERYMGSFETSKTDGTILSLFKKKETPKEERKPNGELNNRGRWCLNVGEAGASYPTNLSQLSKTELAIELLKELSPEQIMDVISAINK